MFEQFVYLYPFNIVEVFIGNYSTVLVVINYKREQQFDIETLQGF